MCDISIIICTRNRGNILEASLDIFNNLTFKGSWELILVDNGSTDITYNVIESFKERKKIDLHVLQESMPGLSRARNTGLSHARGEIIAFTDDDCYPNNDYLSSLYKAFSNLDIDFLGGRVLLFDPTDLKITIQENPNPETIEKYSFISSGFIHGANMAFKKSSLLRMNGFDERLGAGTRFKSGEDTDIIQRLSISGYVGIYDPSVCVYHHHRRKSEKEKKLLLNNYCKGRGARYLKYLIFKNTRHMYVRVWYRQFRSFIRGHDRYYILLEIIAAIEFYMLYGPTQSKIWNHPHDHLNIDTLIYN